MRVLGIDEAGRGCVLGDLCIGAFLVDDPDDDLLRAAGAADSKKLSAKRRLEARERLKHLGRAEVRRVSPEQIDAGNLNALEEAEVVRLVRELRPDHVFMDALGHPNTVPGLVARLRAQVEDVCTPGWTVEPKADHTYAVVGAASIFAKTERDERLEALQVRWGILGSGYPSDPKTRAWLLAHARAGAPWPAFVRTRWQTIQDLAQVSLL